MAAPQQFKLFPSTEWDFNNLRSLNNHDIGVRHLTPTLLSLVKGIESSAEDSSS
jgi:hypothetical protein